MTKLHTLTLSEMKNGLKEKKFSATELVTSHINRIKETNELYNSVITLSEETALNRAKEIDKELSKNEPKGLLTAIPILIKDQIITKGIETTCGSKMLKGFIPPYDATVIEKLKKEGAIILGKTNQDEFAMGSSNETSFFGAVKNPRDITRVPGGTSGGSAVSVLVGQSPVSLGTDTGGSIRQPASFTGVVGIKPTYGRVSRYGAISYASSLDQIGTFGRNTLDAAICLQAISGLDPKDSTSMDVEVDDFISELNSEEKKSLEGIKIGVPKEYFIEGVNEEVKEGVKKGLSVLESLGAILVPISLPHTEYAISAYYIIATAEASSNLARFDGVRYGHRAKNINSLSEHYQKTRKEGFGAEVKRRIIMGNYVLSAGYYDAYYKKAQQVRTIIINDFKSAFSKDCDVIITPVSPTTAFKIGEKATPLEMYLADIFSITANLAGIPGLSLPVGKDSNSLPIGMQILGKPFSEKLLLKMGHAFEHANSSKLADMTDI